MPHAQRSSNGLCLLPVPQGFGPYLGPGSGFNRGCVTLTLSPVLLTGLKHGLNPALCKYAHVISFHPSLDFVMKII